MDIERVDWWEKEKPPFIWIKIEDVKAWNKFKRDRFLLIWEQGLLNLTYKN